MRYSAAVAAPAIMSDPLGKVNPDFATNLDAATTDSQGFPSIGYTYDKNPYQIFEPGAGKSPWATPDRDPRKIIDRSIREIAAELLTGRFYTRRV